MNGKLWAAVAAFLLLAACAPPPKTVAVIQSATPSPSPTPTTTFAMSGPGFHAGEVGVAYGAVPLPASGGVQPYRWSISSGALPAGLVLGQDGTVSGTPTSAGHYTFTIQAADSGDSSATVAGTINVASRLSAGLLPACATSCNVQIGCSNACGAFGQVAAGVAPLSYTVKQGPLPVGTTLSPNSLTLNGTFAGKSGYLQFTVQVADAFGATTTVSPTFWMYPHITVSGGTCTGRGGCNVKLAFSGGTPGSTPLVSPGGWSGTLKCGSVAPVACPEPSFGVSYQPGIASVTLTYQPNSPATFGTLTVRIVSSDLCSQGVHCEATAAVAVVG